MDHDWTEYATSAHHDEHHAEIARLRGERDYHHKRASDNYARASKAEAELAELRETAKVFVDFFENDLGMTDPGDGTVGSQMDAADSIALDKHEDRLRQLIKEKP